MSDSDDDLFGEYIEAKITHAQLELEQSRLGVFLDLVPAGLFIHQRQGVIFANSEASHIIGLPICDLVGRHFLDFIPGDQYEDARVVFDKCFSEGKTIRGLEIVLYDQGETKHIIQVSMSPLLWEGLPLINILFTDISELKEKERLLFHLSTTDSLTGAFNRRHFLAQMELELSRYLRQRVPLSILSLDIDHFKRINDTHGHAAGDLAIRAFVEAIAVQLSQADRVGRMGGEEFCVLLPATGLRDAALVAENIRRSVAALKLPVESGPLRFTTCVGVAEVTENDTVDSLLRRADIALYRAKREGRNRVVTA